MEVEVADYESAVDAYRELQRVYKGGTGVSEKGFKQVLDAYLKDGTVSSEAYDACSTSQQEILQTIKKSIKRIKHD